MEKVIIEINQEQADYLQRLGADVDARVFLLDRMMDNHKFDEDLSLFNSVPYQHYYREYQEALLSFEEAKRCFQNDYLVPIIAEKYPGHENSFTWRIDDYLSLTCEVTLD